MTSVVIVGAGISGLALGWYLKQRHGSNISLKILEAGSHPGGWIRTHTIDGCLFEAGPRSCRTRGAGVDTLELIEALGLEEEVIAAAPAARQRYLYSDGRLKPVPRNIASFLFSPLMRGVLPALWKEWRTPPKEMDDESIASFVERRFGADLAERFADPLVSGIYAGDIHRLSVRACFPDLPRLEQEHGSVIKGMLFGKKPQRITSPFVTRMSREPIFSFRSGMETLVKKLHAELNSEIHLSCAVSTLRPGVDGVEVICQDGRTMRANQVFLALPEKEAAALLPAQIIEVGKTASVAVVNLGWKKDVLQQEGFGYLVPSREKETILGCVWDSSAFPQQNKNASQTRLTVMLGGVNQPDIETLSQEEILYRAREAIARHLSITQSPDALHVTIARQAIPQYEVGHHLRLQTIEETLSQYSGGRIRLAGSAWYGVAVNECIAHAKCVAQQSKA